MTVQQKSQKAEISDASDAPVVSGHTPTPWVIPQGEDNGHVVCIGDDPKNPGRILFILRTPSGTSDVLTFEELSAHAAFIVRAVNSHEALVRAMDECQRALAMMVQPSAIKATSSMNAWTIAVMAEASARAALASTREVQS
jgi:hypothetical protein